MSWSGFCPRAARPCWVSPSPPPSLGGLQGSPAHPPLCSGEPGSSPGSWGGGLTHPQGLLFIEAEGNVSRPLPSRATQLSIENCIPLSGHCGRTHVYSGGRQS